MAAGFPTKVTYANGDVFNASDINDTNGTLNLINPSAKGDLYVGSAANTYTKLSVGTNGQLLSADSTAATGTKWTGIWQAYTPTLTNITIGNGTTEGRYRQLGNTVDVVCKITFGTSTTISSFGGISLPVNAKYTSVMIGSNSYIDSGTTYYTGPNFMSGANSVWFGVDNASTTYNNINTIGASTPFTWGSTDVIFATLSYEVA
jgi:hypothetical protein